MPVFINDVEITDEAVFEEMQHHPALSIEEAQVKAASALAIRHLLIQEARQQGLTPPDLTAPLETQENFLIEALLDQELRLPEADDASCLRYYIANHPQFVDQQGQNVPFEFVREPIAQFLKDASWQTAARHYIKILAGRAKIVGLNLDVATSPLVN